MNMYYWTMVVGVMLVLALVWFVTWVVAEILLDDADPWAHVDIPPLTPEDLDFARHIMDSKDRTMVYCDEVREFRYEQHNRSQHG